MPGGFAGYALIGYFVALIVLSLVRAVPVKSRAIQRLRAFFPSWKFFDDVGDAPVLLMRTGTGDDDDQLGPWQPVLAPVPRHLGAVLLNPEANLALAYGSLLSQLVADVEELADDAEVEDVVSYQLVHHLVRARAAMPAGVHYQWKLCLVTPGAAPGPDDDMLVSTVYET